MGEGEDGADTSAVIRINRRKATKYGRGEGGKEWQGWRSMGDHAVLLSAARGTARETLRCGSGGQGEALRLMPIGRP